MPQSLAAMFELGDGSVMRSFAKWGTIRGARGEARSGLKRLGDLKGIWFPVRCHMKLPTWLDLLV